MFLIPKPTNLSTIALVLGLKIRPKIGHHFGGHKSVTFGRVQLERFKTAVACEAAVAVCLEKVSSCGYLFE